MPCVGGVEDADGGDCYGLGGVECDKFRLSFLGTLELGMEAVGGLLFAGGENSRVDGGAELGKELGGVVSMVVGVTDRLLLHLLPGAATTTVPPWPRSSAAVRR